MLLYSKNRIWVAFYLFWKLNKNRNNHIKCFETNGKEDYNSYILKNYYDKYSIW